MRIPKILLFLIFLLTGLSARTQTDYLSSTDSSDWTVPSFEPKKAGSDSHTLFNDFILHHNYPNPITGYLTIHYEVNRPGHYVVSVVGNQGKEIKRLIDGPLRAGTYKFNWLASPHSQGIYMYRLVGGKQFGPRRLLLLY